ncbi:MAG: hypothetical protein FJ149_03725 [Euryarchaeota archaeon]|nr:hypothetical protein [Euryarchaeota archaeon]
MRAPAAGLLLLVLVLPAAAAATGPRTPDQDNSFDAATGLPASGYRTGDLSWVDDRADFFRLSATSGMVIRAFIFIVDWQAASPGDVDFSLVLFDRTRSEIANSSSGYQYETVSALAVAAGTYYLRVSTVSGSGTYSLDWSVAPPQTLKDGDEIRGLLSDSGNRNADWYRVQLRGGPAPDTFKATMHEDGGAFFDLYFMDLWSEYSLWYDISWWSDPDDQVEATATYGGWYYLWVSAYRGAGNYTLKVTVAPGTGDGDSEPSGARLVAWNSSFYDTVDMAHDHYDWYRCELSAGENIRASMRLDPAPTDMFALSILGADLSTLPGAMGTNYFDRGAEPPLLNRTIAVNATVAAAGTYYVVAMARVGLRDTVRDLSDQNARSDYKLTINMSAHAPGPSNHAPRALVPGATVSLDANTTAELALPALFEDPDGDTLRYASSGNGSVRLDFSRAGRAVLRPDEYYVGHLNFTLNATDPEGLSAAVWVDVTVRKVPFPPVITDRTPSSGALHGVNGTTVQFTVSAMDPNHQVLAYGWTANGAPVGTNANLLSWKVPAASGSFVIGCTVSNADGNASTSWTLNATAKAPPVVAIVTPWNHSTVREGARVTFSAVVSETSVGQAAEFAFAWSLRGRALGTGAVFSTTTLPPGENTVVVTVVNVSDPAETGSASIVVFVEAKEAAADYTTVLLAAGALLVVVAVIGVLLTRRAARRRDAEEEELSPRRRHRRVKPGKRERRARRGGTG